MLSIQESTLSYHSRTITLARKRAGHLERLRVQVKSKNNLSGVGGPVYTALFPSYLKNSTWEAPWFCSDLPVAYPERLWILQVK